MMTHQKTKRFAWGALALAAMTAVPAAYAAQGAYDERAKQSANANWQNQGREG